MSVKPSYAELERLCIKALGRSKALYGALFEHCHSVMLIINPETGAILDANEAACAFYGYAKHQLIKMQITQINTLSPQQIAEAMCKAVAVEKKYFIFKHRLASGEIRDVEVYTGPIRYGDAHALYSIIYDISERIGLQERFLQEKLFSDSLISSLPGIMYLLDESIQFVRWNRNLEIITGFSSDELQGMQNLDIISGKDKKKISDAIREVFQTGQANVEAELVTKAGRVIPYFLTGIRFTMDYRPYLVGVGFDITERVRTENDKLALIGQLQSALSEVKKLSGFLPICANCKKIRDDKGYWKQIETYIRDHSEAEFSHSICPECAAKLYPSMQKHANTIDP